MLRQRQARKGKLKCLTSFLQQEVWPTDQSESDARHMLGLSTGSSFYASALTVIIDDVGGHLPLHPTKQDISFGQQNKGAIHEENLFAWVGAGEFVRISIYIFLV